METRSAVPNDTFRSLTGAIFERAVTGRCATEPLQLCLNPPSRLTIMQVNQARRSTTDNDEEIVVICLADF